MKLQFALAAAAVTLASCASTGLTPSEMQIVRNVQTIDDVLATSIPAVQCVLAQIAGGDQDPAHIATECGGITIISVLAIIDAVDAAIVGDAGVMGPPPPLGAPM